MLTTAAFTRLFGESVRQAGPKAAWRPQLLVTVRRIAGEWDADKRRELLHPELQSGPDDGGRAAARLLPPENRRLVARAFQRLPEPTRCILWHAEVEAEDLAIPAGLLGLAVEDAPVELERARQLLRQNCLEIHREVAPDEECRRYSRLLDVSLRRVGGTVDPDLRQHVADCAHCQGTADQLNQSVGRLAVLLAEGVLGWAAQPYLESRPGRRTGIQETQAGPVVTTDPGTDPHQAPELHPGTGPYPGTGLHPDHGPYAGTGSRPGMGPHPDMRTHGATGAYPGVGSRQGTGRYPAADPNPVTGLSPAAGPHPTAAPPRGTGPRHAVRLPPHADARAAGVGRRSPRRRRNLALAVLAVSGSVLVPLGLWSSGGDDDRRPSSADSGTSAEDPGLPSRVDTGDSQPAALSGRLRNVASGDCVGIAEGKAAEGSEAVLATCTSSQRQQWSYESDGLLRSVADSDLCLDSRLAYSVRLGPCEVEKDQDDEDQAKKDQDKKDQAGVHYDFTDEGNLVPFGKSDLALAPVSGDEETGLVLKARDDSPAQRWEFDTSVDSLQMEWITSYTNGDRTEPVRSARPEPTRAPSPEPKPTPSEASPTPRPTTPTPTPSWACYGYYCWPAGSDGGGGYGGGYGGGGYGGGYGGGGYGGGYGGR
ncbi:ricin-type beta-trefoil lectin domain protein [Streptomyces sp. NPDC050704]|uniref:ricin-type beta-trefoil lectin domain protein n=1 Tax=Streptomyces sp. NPDC050704 TaxID=3157219 RepID=UPI00343198EA